MKTVCAIIGLVTITSCASIVSKSKYPVNIESKPSGASITITNSEGTLVYSGETPAMIDLKTKKAFFQKRKLSD